MKYGITGATGQLGRLVVESLRTKVDPSAIVALVRDPARVADLGVEARRFDYDRPEGLGPALEGVDALLLVSASEVGRRVGQHAGVVAAAGRAGIGRLLYTSLLHADRSPLFVADDHVRTERAIRDSGVPFTFLRNSLYSEFLEGAIAQAAARGEFVGSAGEGRLATATRRDYAEAAAAALAAEGLEGRTLELAGDRPFTMAELAEEVSRQSGRRVSCRNVPEAEYASVLAGSGMPKPQAEAFARWDVGVSEGALDDDGRELSRLIGRPTTPIAATVSEALKGRP